MRNASWWLLIAWCAVGLPMMMVLGQEPTEAPITATDEMTTAPATVPLITMAPVMTTIDNISATEAPVFALTEAPVLVVSGENITLAPVSIALPIELPIDMNDTTTEFVNCRSACPDGSNVPDPNAMAQPGQTCGQLDASLADGLASGKVCQTAQYLGVASCGCAPSAIPPVCQLCEDGMAPENLEAKTGYEIPGSTGGLTTCLELAVFITSSDFELFRNQCAGVQATFGQYCGCRGNNAMPSCRLCGDGNLLANPEIVLPTSGLTCGTVELQSNNNPGSCTTLQQDSFGTCCPSLITPAPTASPTPGTPTTDSPTATPSPTSQFQVQYFDEPIARWTTRLNNGTDIQSRPVRGNAVTVSPDGLFVYVTREDGRLDVLSSVDGSPQFFFEPPLGIANYPIECNSGVYFGELDGEPFAIYAIIDRAPPQAGLQSASRIIAIAQNSFEVLFISESLEGVVVGTPIVTEMGEFIYLTRNTNVGSSSLPETGHFTILQVRTSGTILFTESISEVDESNILPYGPLGVSHSPTGGKYEGGSSNENDLVVWTSSADGGFGAPGFTRAFQLPINFTSDLAGTSLGTVALRSVRWNAIARPVLTADGQGLFAFIREAGVRGWVGERSFQAGATWSAQLTRNAENAGTPIQNSGALSFDEDRIFIPEAGNSLAALDTATGSILWQAASASPFATEPQTTMDDEFVFAIQSNGVITSYNQMDGTELWSIDCGAFVAPCAAEVRAEFSISPDGTDLFFGDILGNIRAVRLGELLNPPTESPTTSPGRDVPITDSPVAVSPTMSPVATVTAAPVTMAPVTVAPVTAAPVTMDPNTTTPVTMAPNATTPVTTAPATMQPTTAPPMTPQPTDTPTTATPTIVLIPSINSLTSGAAGPWSFLLSWVIGTLGLILI